ncbi:bacterial regulatory s, gntR family protein, partial [Vibrio parahaemolyticus V-223/04]
SG